MIRLLYKTLKSAGRMRIKFISISIAILIINGFGIWSSSYIRYEEEVIKT